MSAELSQKGSRRNCLYSWSSNRRLTDEEYHKQFVARFWSYVDKNGPTIRPELGPCWLWTGSLATRPDSDKYGHYGQIGFRFPNGKRRPLRAHVASFYIHNGRMASKGMQICHHCDNPPCVNPTHLWEGTARQNTKDSQRKGRKALKRTDTREKSVRVRLTPQQCGLIKAARIDRDLSIYDMQEMFGIDYVQYWRLERDMGNSIYLEQLHGMLRFLEIDDATFNLQTEQSFLTNRVRKDFTVKPLTGQRYKRPVGQRVVKDQTPRTITFRNIVYIDYRAALTHSKVTTGQAFYARARNNPRRLRTLKRGRLTYFRLDDILNFKKLSGGRRRPRLPSNGKA